MGEKREYIYKNSKFWGYNADCVQIIDIQKPRTSILINFI